MVMTGVKRAFFIWALLISSQFLHIPCFHHISEFNVAFDPLHFVLMFPRGEAGWGLGIPKGILRNVPDAMPIVGQAFYFHHLRLLLPGAVLPKKRPLFPVVHLALLKKKYKTDPIDGFFCLFILLNHNLKLANDDIGAVDEPPGGGGGVTNVLGQVTGADVDLEDRGLGEVAVEEDGGVSTRGRTVTLRDFMAFYLFTRRLGSARLFFSSSCLRKFSVECI